VSYQIDYASSDHPLISSHERVADVPSSETYPIGTCSPEFHKLLFDFVEFSNI
jgi:hypothetical protein